MGANLLVQFLHFYSTEIHQSGNKLEEMYYSLLHRVQSKYMTNVYNYMDEYYFVEHYFVATEDYTTYIGYYLHC